MDESKIDDNEIKNDFKFTIIFDAIKLQDIDPDGCFIKYRHDSFLPEQQSFEINFVNTKPKHNKIERIQGTGSIFTLSPRRTNIQVQDILENVCLEIEVWKDDEMIGSAKVCLDNIYQFQSKDTKFDKKCQTVLVNTNKKEIGFIDTIIILDLTQLPESMREKSFCLISDRLETP